MYWFTLYYIGLYYVIMKKRRGGSKRRLRPSELAKANAGKPYIGCLSCHRLEMKVGKLESDWAGIVRANIRLVLWAKRQKIELPTDFKLKKLFPLKNYE